MSHADFLFELGSEELPPTALKRLRDALRDGIAEGLEKAGLQVATIQAYAAPRRLAVLLQQCQTRQTDVTQTRKGPALQAAFDDDGKPKPAAIGFAKSCGVEVSELDRLQEGKGEWLSYEQTIEGQFTAELLPQIIQTALDRLPIPKRMRWGDHSVEFVRPVHWVVLMQDVQIIPAQFYQIQTGNQTRGHRFHAPQAITLAKAGDYAQTLRETGFVEADFAKRQQDIATQAQQAAADQGLQVVMRDALLEEVTALNEWPQVIVGEFDADFLSVPQEALISAMESHQKYFSLVDHQQKLTNQFITFANIASKDPAKIQDGNQRVIRPRLKDAQFFWQQDLKTGLSQLNEGLANVVFQQQLGTVADKVNRVVRLSDTVATMMNLDDTQRQALAMAAQWCKADLMSEMVGEFPDLQGLMGRYYADAENQPLAVSNAMEQHYWPLKAGSPVANEPEAQALAIADKADTLAGIFAIGQMPTGDKDPFALRRTALGLGRTLIENQCSIGLTELYAQACAGQQPWVTPADDLVGILVDFTLDRLKVYFQDQGYHAEQIEAVRQVSVDNLTDFAQRLAAVQAFAAQEAATSLAAANKRIGNILKKQTAPSATVDTTLFQQAEEQQLWQAFSDIQSDVTDAVAQADYVTALTKLSQLKQPVDAYFDGVMVMAEDATVQSNRLATLRDLQQAFMQIADIAVLS